MGSIPQNWILTRKEISASPCGMATGKARTLVEIIKQ